jgi:hypothetical protein
MSYFTRRLCGTRTASRIVTYPAPDLNLQLNARRVRFMTPLTAPLALGGSLEILSRRCTGLRRP